MARRARKRSGGLRAVGAAIESGLGGRGFPAPRLLMRWEGVVGGEIAAWTQPERLVRGTLHLRVASGWAPYIQHQAPQICERVNAFLGRRAVARLALRQGRLAAPPTRPRLAAPGEPVAVSGVGDPQLRAALARLGGAVRAAERPGVC